MLLLGAFVKKISGGPGKLSLRRLVSAFFPFPAGGLAMPEQGAIVSFARSSGIFANGNILIAYPATAQDPPT